MTKCSRCISENKSSISTTSWSSMMYFFFFQAKDGIRNIGGDWISDVCSSDLVWLTSRVHPDSVELTVENTGDKLIPQSVSALVEPFQRGTDRIRTNHPGVGLGLAIANRDRKSVV